MVSPWSGNDPILGVFDLTKDAGAYQSNVSVKETINRLARCLAYDLPEGK